MRLLWLCFLGSVLCVCGARDEGCLRSASNCDRCLNSGPDCGWCMDSNHRTRCDTEKRLQRAGCSRVYNPKGKLTITSKNEGRSIPLGPQEISVSLRPGVNLLFPMEVDTQDPLLQLEAYGAPEGLNITFKKLTVVSGLFFKVSLKVEECPPQNQTGPWSVHIRPSGFSDSNGAKLEINVDCGCSCLDRPQPLSPHCSLHGTFTCGLCTCDPLYVGDRCETHVSSLEEDANDPEAPCRKGPGASVCSGRGLCEEGYCVCNKLENSTLSFFGRFCECNNFECPLRNGSLCGGQGKCECGQCVCEYGWTGDDCGCSMDPAPCRSENQLMCSGKGICYCGVCVCEGPYSGPLCESCPTCSNLCQDHSRCAECRVFQTHRCEEECRLYTVSLVDSRDDLPAPRCRWLSQQDSCFFHFSYSSSKHLTVTKSKECPGTT